MSFSQSLGITPKKAIQINTVDKSLRNCLWNILCEYFWYKMKMFTQQLGDSSSYIQRIFFLDIQEFLRKLWLDHFGKLIDDMPSSWGINFGTDYYGEIKEHFFNCQWYEVYDFIEFLIEEYPPSGSTYTGNLIEDFVEQCNKILEQEVSAYRLVGTKFVPTTSQTDVSAMEEALEAASGVGLQSVYIHLNDALRLYSDRKNPDYRNSMKESISAVEAICKLIAGDPKTTLGKALRTIGSKAMIPLHSSLESAFSYLYSYTSDSGGIRHSLKDEPSPESEDAKFMLIACSAFISYLIEKSLKAGISF